MSIPRRLVFFIQLVLLPMGPYLFGQEAEPIYDEASVPLYTLPDPLVMNDGNKVRDDLQWWSRRRKEILRLFTVEVYGEAPGRPRNQSFRIRSENNNALNGKAIRKEIEIYFLPEQRGPRLDLLLYLPKNSSGPVPVFIGLNFYGNHTISSDPSIMLSTSWMRDNKELGIVENKATEASRGKRTSRWPVERILERGYGLATMYYGDIDPDYDDGFKNGVHPLSYRGGQTRPTDDQWGSISAWAWGLSRAADYLVTDKGVDKRRIAVLGHSRLGKTALWAGAVDERFTLVISNNSGCGGAALFRRRFGETVSRINNSFPHWFCFNFKNYDDREDSLPIDQHMLLSLIAPRPVYIASAQEDLWADPRGEYLSAFHATPVFELLGGTGIPSEQMPALNEPIMNTIGYHVRTGGHDVTSYDWERFMDFADKHFRKRSQ